MQRQRGAANSFSEVINIDQGFVLNNAGMNQQTSLNNMLNPVENRLTNNTASSGEASCLNAINHGVQSFSDWNAGESSSSFSPENQVNDDRIEMEERWPAPRSPERHLMHSNVSNLLFPGRANIGLSGDEVTSAGLILHGSSSHHAPPSLNSNAAYVGDSGNSHHPGALLTSNHFHSAGKEIEQASPSSVSSDDVGNSSGTSGYMLEDGNGGPSSSLGGWGLSCKRKALEGASSSSGHVHPGGSSSYLPQAENSSWHTGPTHHNTSSGLCLPMSLRDSPSISSPGQVNPRSGFGSRRVHSGSDTIPSSSVTGNVDHLRFFGRRINPGQQQEPLTFNLSIAAGPRRSTVWSTHQPPRSVQPSDSLELRSTPTDSNSSAAQGQPHAVHASTLSRNVHPLPWTGASNLRAGNPSSSLIPGERVAALRGEVNIGSIPRNNVEHPMFVPPAEMRNTAQDSRGWSVATGNTNASGSVPSSRIGPSSSIHPVPAPSWLTHHEPTTQNQQRSTEIAPWSLFPLMDSESGSHSDHFPSPSSGPSASSQETLMSSASISQGHSQPFPRSAFFMDGRVDDALGMPRSLRALAADIEGRHRLISEIRQVLNAMRRGENLRVEDYMLFDPFIYHGMSEMHDRHRDLRLDVDNMSYEELLALEERIGDVSTGLSEETILRLMKQKKYTAVTTESPSDVEPCCICQA
uniref:RING-type E3 ubiquitin transferase n=1 Tax=Rhizophora mucronata TaxID=61149 RepID=A0A2P2KX57_RHIMU